MITFNCPWIDCSSSQLSLSERAPINCAAKSMGTKGAEANKDLIKSMKKIGFPLSIVNFSYLFTCIVNCKESYIIVGHL